MVSNENCSVDSRMIDKASARAVLIWATIMTYTLDAISAHCEKGQSHAKMSRVSRGISLVVFFFMFLISFGLKRVDDSRFRFRIVRRTKVKKLQKVNENDFYGIVSSEAGTSGEENSGDDFAEQGNSFSEKKQKKKRARFKKNKVVPTEDTYAWTKASTKTPQAASRYEEENCCSSSMVLAEESYKSSSLGTDLSSFLNVLPPPTPDNFNVCNTDKPSGDQPISDEDVPNTNERGCVLNQVALNLTEGNAWEETDKGTNKKSALSNFIARFKDRPKTTKVRKFRK